MKIVKFICEWWIEISALVLVLVFSIILVMIMPNKTSVTKPNANVHTLTNDEIIAENKKCVDAGMKPYLRMWQEGYGAADVICFPAGQNIY